MKKDAKDISVIMPALNEEAAIADAINSTLEAFSSLDLNGEIVVVNDGSTDRTAGIVSKLSEEHEGKILVVTHEKPMGVGRSFFDGVAAATGEGVTVIPGDNENDPVEVLRSVPLLAQVDIVCPYVINKEVRGAMRNIISGLFTFIINFTFRTSFKYTNGTIIYRRSVLNGFVPKSGGFFAQAETLIKSVRKGYLCAEVPYFLSRRKGGVSKALTLSSLMKVIKGYGLLIRDIYFTPSNDTVEQDSMRYIRGKKYLD